MWQTGAMENENESRPKRKYRTASERADLVAAFLRSGLSQRDFALPQGIAPSNIERWVRQGEAVARSAGPAALGGRAGGAARRTRCNHRAYASVPRALPSWVTMLTGRHAHQHF